MQIPGTIQILAKRFPGVPIVYNIVSRGSPSDVVRQELETELRKLQAGIDVEMIWRS